VERLKAETRKNGWTADVVGFKDGLLSKKVCVLRNLVVRPYFPCKHNIHD
jgi:hypothetical protein